MGGGITSVTLSVAVVVCKNTLEEDSAPHSGLGATEPAEAAQLHVALLWPRASWPNQLPS